MFKSYKHTIPLLCATVLYCSIAQAQENVAVQNAEACAEVVSNAERLVCYDKVFKSNNTAVESLEVFAQSQSNTQQEPAMQVKSDVMVPKPSTTSLLDQRWELTEETKKGVWHISPYQPVYVLPVFWTTKKNELPSSPNPRNTVSIDEKNDLNSMESKFQISMKTKALENIFGDNGDLWLGYTQSSHWQVYNSEDSRPFRATNYEPEASLMFRTNYNILGLNGRLLGVGFNHQSNGSADPYSRSWNRVIFNLGFEQDNFVLMVRPWFRIPEKNRDDDNPDIIDYMGRGDITAFYKWRDQEFSLMLRHNLKTSSDAHGAAQFDWAFPISGRLRGHVQIFDGYGESLIDYNHRATYFGLGVSLINWY